MIVCFRWSIRQTLLNTKEAKQRIPDTRPSDSFMAHWGDRLTHWGRGKMDTILQTTHSNFFNVWFSIKISLKFIS